MNKDSGLPCEVALPHNGSTLGGGGGRAREIEHCWAKFQKNHLFRATTIGDRTLFVAAVRAGVCWPIYRVILLVPTVLIHPTPIIIGVSCINTSNTKKY
jgi:hypothetical protein